MGRRYMMCTRHPVSADILCLRALWKEAFGDSDAFLDSFFRCAFAAERSLCLEDNGEITAALYWFDCAWNGMRIAYLYAVAVAERHRGRGFCRRLLTDTHAHLSSLGYAGVILVPGSASLFDLYAHLGYRIGSSVDEFLCEAADSGISLRKIDAAAYAAQRVRYLPEGSVLHEMKNLQFLSVHSELYAGEDVLLAAHRENSVLIADEFLGNRLAAPHILHALGCPRGVFRTVGSQRPFAMYLSLREDITAMPDYFGIAFD